MTTVVPPNYLTATFYDWFKSYAEHHLKYVPSTYASYKPELTLLYFNSMPEKIEAFEKKLKNFIEWKGKILDERKKLFSDSGNMYGSYGTSSYNAEKDADNNDEIFAFNKSYLIGKAIKTELIGQVSLDDDECGEMKFKFHISRVTLSESRPTGSTNLSLPSTCLSYDNYVNKNNITDPSLYGFLGSKEAYRDLTPIFDEEEASPKAHKNNSPESRMQGSSRNFDKTNNDRFIVRDYVFRISLSNKTSESYVIKLLLAWENDPQRSEELTFGIRSRKSNGLVHNLILRDPDDSFAGLRISVSYKKVDSTNLKYLSNDDFSETVEIFNLPLEKNENK